MARRARGRAVVGSLAMALGIAAGCAAQQRSNPHTAWVPATPDPEALPSPNTSGGVVPNPPPTDLRAIDWANREYVPGLDHLKNGRGELREYSEDYAGLHDTTTWELVMSSFGDLDGDGQEEAVIVLKESWFPPSGEGRAEEKGYVFRLVNKKVVQVGSPLRAAHVQSVAVLQDRIILFDGGCSVYRLQDDAWQRQPEEHCPAE